MLPRRFLIDEEGQRAVETENRSDAPGPSRRPPLSPQERQVLHTATKDRRKAKEAIANVLEEARTGLGIERGRDRGGDCYKTI